MRNAKIYPFLGTAAYLALIAMEAYHLWVIRYPWPGQTMRGNFVSYALLAAWAAAVAGLWVKRAWAYPVLVVAAVITLAHTVVLALGGAGWVPYYFAAFVAGALFSFLSKNRKFFPENRAQPGAPLHSHRQAS